MIIAIETLEAEMATVDAHDRRRPAQQDVDAGLVMPVGKVLRAVISALQSRPIGRPGGAEGAAR